MCITCGCSTTSDHEHVHEHEHRHGDQAHNHSHPHSHDHEQGDHHHHHDHLHDNGQPHDHSHDEPQRSKKISIEEDVLARNNRLAAFNRALFKEKGILVLNLVSSPGSGKTTLLERTLRDLSGKYRCAVIEGDQQTDNDARRIAATGVPVRQINTGAGCHLDAQMVMHATEAFDLDQLDILFIENVGNLVCPAAFDLGEAHKVVVLSVTEGEDKPLKYPQMFHNSGLMLLNKVDLLPYLSFDVAQCKEYAGRVSHDLAILEVSATSGQGLEGWYGWLERELGR
jgi:hydrogenase nickel incorporation protein HypB